MLKPNGFVVFTDRVVRVGSPRSKLPVLRAVDKSAFVNRSPVFGHYRSFCGRDRCGWPGSCCCSRRGVGDGAGGDVFGNGRRRLAFLGARLSLALFLGPSGGWRARRRRDTLLEKKEQRKRRRRRTTKNTPTTTAGTSFVMIAFILFWVFHKSDRITLDPTRPGPRD